MMVHLKTALKKLLAESSASPSAALNADLIKMCAAICELFPVVQQSNKNFLEELFVVVVDAEIELGQSLHQLHPHLTKFCCKMKTLNYKSIEIFLTEERIASHGWHQLLMNILREKSDEGARIRQACESHTSKLIQLGLSHNIEDVYQTQTMADVQFRVIEVVHLLAKYRPDYLNNQHLLLDHLKNIWMNPTFRQRFKSIPPPTPAPVNYREAILIGRIFLITVETNPESVEYLFQLQRINQMRTLAQFGNIMATFKFWFKYRLMKVYTIDQQRTVISRFLVNWHKKKGYEDDLKASIITNVIIPVLEHSNQEKTQNALLGEVNFNNDEDLVGQIIKTLIESDLSGQSDLLNRI